jgi:hypothetical protein
VITQNCLLTYLAQSQAIRRWTGREGKPLKAKFEKLEGTIVKNMKEELNIRGIGDSKFHMNRILQALQDTTTNRMVGGINAVGQSNQKQMVEMMRMMCKFL